MNNKTEIELKKAEADYWDRRALARTKNGQIPLEADTRRATRFHPQNPDQEPIDPKMDRILQGAYVTRFIDLAVHTPGGRVLEVGCGPGWLALELGRRGMTVDAYDLSPGAIAIARQMLRENPYRENFGRVNYYVEDVTAKEFGREKYDAVVGWSSFHHLPNLREFMDRVWVALKPGGILVTMDDMPLGFLERGLKMFIVGLFPRYNMSYRQKFAMLLQLLFNKHRVVQTWEPSPLETLSTLEIAPILYERYEIIEDFNFNAFSSSLSGMSGPDSFRYAVAHVSVWFDRLLCRLGICQGFFRIIAARKKS